MFRLPDFSVVVLLRRTDEFAALKAELLGAAVTEAARGARAAAGDASDRIPQRRISFFLWPPEKTARQAGLR
jgi:hypothetical protein